MLWNLIHVFVQGVLGSFCGVRCDEIRGKKGIDIWGFTVFYFSHRNTAGRETSKYVAIM